MTEAEAALREAWVQLKELQERMRLLEAKVAASQQVAQLIIPGASS